MCLVSIYLHCPLLFQRADSFHLSSDIYRTQFPRDCSVNWYHSYCRLATLLNTAYTPCLKKLCVKLSVHCLSGHLYLPHTEAVAWEHPPGSTSKHYVSGTSHHWFLHLYLHHIQVKAERKRLTTLIKTWGKLINHFYVDWNLEIYIYIFYTKWYIVEKQ